MKDLDVEDFGQRLADAVESYLVPWRAIARDGTASTAIPMLLLEVSQIMLAGARLGVQVPFVPDTEFQPDAGRHC